MRIIPPLLSSICLFAPALSHSQAIPLTSTTGTPVNWQTNRRPNASVDIDFPLDLNGDGVNDIVFHNVNREMTGPGQSSYRYWSVNTNSADFTVACDNIYTTSYPLNFQAGQAIASSNWKQFSPNPFQNPGYLDYTFYGYNAPRVIDDGNFKDGTPGYMAVRQNVGGTFLYWWIEIQARYQPTAAYIEYRRINYYGPAAALPTATFQPVAKAIEAYPNPTGNQGWKVVTPEPGIYQLYDVCGRLLDTGKTNKESLIPTANLLAGWYALRLQQPDGTIRVLRLQKL